MALMSRVGAGVAVIVVVACVGVAAAGENLLGSEFPYDAFDRLPSTRIDVGGSVLSVAFAPGAMGLSRAAVLTWVNRCATGVATYFGRFPTPTARVLIVPASGVGVHGGKTWGIRGAASRVTLGDETTARQLDRDWVLVHELTHYAFPEVGDAQHWMEEGLATYVEPIARRQIGALSDEKVWGDLVDGLPRGLPAAGDRGLDRTPTWGRTYWGGAMFYLLADVDIRRGTDNRRGLQDALRALVAAGGDITRRWPVERVLASADEGTGVHVLEEMYARMKETPEHVDLPDLWRRLGVVVQGGTVRFDDSAPLADIRRAITAAPIGAPRSPATSSAATAH
jgi:hypothetical protein